MMIKKALFVFVLLLLLVGIAAAQDATPEATPAEATTEATLIEATAEATSIAPTAEATSVKATAEATTELTAEATSEATSEATAEATPAVRFKAAGSYTVRQQVADLTRQYIVHVPQKYFDDKKSVPLVLMLHGASGTGQGMEAFTGFDKLSDKEGFIVAYPDAINTAWNDGRGDDASVIDDVGYLEHIIDSVAAKADIDRKRVYAAGYSRGGMMAYLLGCVLPDKIAAVVSVSSTFPIYEFDQCKDSVPKPVMIIQGTDDPIVPWMGIQSAYFSATDSLRFWGKHNQCSILGPIKDSADINPLDGTRLLTQEAVKCKQPVILYGVFHGGHTWPGHPVQTDTNLGLTSLDFDASVTIWEFFKAQSLPS
ncbi:MAG: alpha/beta fold hydrolase [Anaerolineae bacterium]|nr:alpha/beta fold hydrolase [Anaerolineae bacterium]